MQDGRFFTDADLEHAAPVCVIGTDVANALFPHRDPIDHQLTLNGRAYQVIGLFEKKGAFFGGSNDNFVAIPITAFDEQFPEVKNGGGDTIHIATVPRRPEDIPALIEQETAILRLRRGLRPGQPDDFAMFTSEGMLRSFQQITGGVAAAMIVVAEYTADPAVPRRPTIDDTAMMWPDLCGRNTVKATFETGLPRHFEFPAPDPQTGEFLSLDTHPLRNEEGQVAAVLESVKLTSGVRREMWARAHRERLAVLLAVVVEVALIALEDRARHFGGLRKPPLIGPHDEAGDRAVLRSHRALGIGFGERPFPELARLTV